MAGDKSLLVGVSVRPSGKKHFCRRNKQHVILKDAGVVVIKQDRSELHYCMSCGTKFIETARRKLDSIEADIQRTSNCKRSGGG